MQKHVLTIVLASILLLGLSHAALADTVAGRWQSDNGFVYSIPNLSNQFVIYVTNSSGQRYMANARWINRSQFRFDFPGSPNAGGVCTYSTQEPNVLRGVSDRGLPFTWMRIR